MVSRRLPGTGTGWPGAGGVSEIWRQISRGLVPAAVIDMGPVGRGASGIHRVEPPFTGDAL